MTREERISRLTDRGILAAMNTLLDGPRTGTWDRQLRDLELALLSAEKRQREQAGRWHG